MNIGNAIKNLRKQKNLSQGALADDIGISQTALSQIESGISKPNPRTLTKICEVLEVSEPVLYILSIDEKDIPKEKKKMYDLLFPDIQKLLFNLLSVDNPE